MTVSANIGLRRSRAVSTRPASKARVAVQVAANTKLYYIPSSCSLATHIVAREADLAIELVKVDVATHKTETAARLLR